MSLSFGEIRRIFLDYFKERGHEIVPSSSLIPRDDPTLLFTNAGMVQFKRLFLGEEKRSYTRAASSQKCVRAGGKHNDLENVGYTARHHTFFEMLGNFSFGDYFKQEAILWAWDLLTRVYGLPPEKMFVSIYKDDEEAYKIWQKEVGIPDEKIVRLGEKDNFWTMGDTGPCGPCSEILIDQGEELSCGSPDCAPGCDCDRYLEIWNLVFTQFDRQPNGELIPLPRPNIDTGMGLERLSAIIQGVSSNYDTDIFSQIMERIEELSGRKYTGSGSKEDVAFRVIADHSRASAFIIGDGVLPSNEGRGYVLRRIIRRAVRFGQVLGLKGVFLNMVTDRVIDIMGQHYGELLISREFINGVVKNEERHFQDTLNYSIRILNDHIDELKAKGEKIIPGEVVFKLYDTYGLSFDIVEDVAKEEGLSVDIEGFNQWMNKRRELSQVSWKGSGEEEIPRIYRKLMSQGTSTIFRGYETTSCEARIIAIVSEEEQVPVVEESREIELILDETPFYGEAGGQVGDTGWIKGESGSIRIMNTVKIGDGIIVHKGRVESGSIKEGERVVAEVDSERRKDIARNHTATHLLHAALREVLGEHVKQAGSLVAPDRLRFDFTHFKKLSSGQIHDVERLVNRRIRENYPLSTRIMKKDEAIKTGAMAIFEERYGETVRLVQIGEDVSKELCGGTHTSRTGDIGVFKIISEGAIGSNLRRIEAVTGASAIEWINQQIDELDNIASLLKGTKGQLTDRINQLLSHQKQIEKELESLRAKLIHKETQELISDVKEIDGIRIISRRVKSESPKELRDFADRIKEKLKSGIVVLGAQKDKKAMLVCVVTKDLVNRVSANDIIRSLSAIVGGKGGGRDDMAQGGGPVTDKLPEALDSVVNIVQSSLKT